MKIKHFLFIRSERFVIFYNKDRSREANDKNSNTIFTVSFCCGQQWDHIFYSHVGGGLTYDADRFTCGLDTIDEF